MRYTFLTIPLCLFAVTAAVGEFRFPMPDFSSGYTHPSLHLPSPETLSPFLDITILTLALLTASLLVLKRRSRREIFLLTLCSLLYFGFIRQGCVCPVGSLQNVVAGIFHSDFSVPFVVLAFFSMPLIFALFCGRIFCAAVCPLGAIQEVVAVKPVKVPSGIDKLLGLIPYLYLGLTILSVVMGAGFIICQYDPFVGFFRLGASFNMLVFGGTLLIIGIFVARPYCRFLCPYGVLLNWMSRLAKWHASITPADCTQCTLCADSCPYNAINTPASHSEPKDTGIKRLRTLLLLLPVIIAIGAATGTALREPLSRMHPTVRLAERIAGEYAGIHTEQTIDSETFRASEKTRAELYSEARTLKSGFAYGGAWFGAFIGLVIGCKLIALTLARKRTNYEPDRGACLSCGRCFRYCPISARKGVQDV